MEKWTCIVVALLVFMVNTVSAEEEKTGCFFGAGYISSELDTGISNLTGNASLEDEDSGFKIFGGCQLNSYVGIELAYSNFGEASLKGDNGDTFALDGTTYTFNQNNAAVTIEGWGLSLGAVFSLPLEKVTGSDYFKWLTPYAKFGGYYLDTELAASTGGVNQATFSDSGFDFYFGGGLRVNLHDNFAVSGEWERYNGDLNIDTLSVNAVDSFV